LRWVLALVSPFASRLRLNELTEGGVDTDTAFGCGVLRVTIIRTWTNKQVLRRNTSVEGQVTTFVIFKTGTFCENVIKVCDIPVRAPSTSETKSCRTSQTSSAVSNSCEIGTGKRRRIDCNVASNAFEVQWGFRNTLTGSIDTISVSRTEQATVEASWRWRGENVTSSSRGRRSAITFGGSVGEVETVSSSRTEETIVQTRRRITLEELD